MMKNKHKNKKTKKKYCTYSKLQSRHDLKPTLFFLPPCTLHERKDRNSRVDRHSMPPLPPQKSLNQAGNNRAKEGELLNGPSDKPLSLPQRWSCAQSPGTC